MRAVVFRKFGGPDVLETAELVRPQPGEGEVVIRVAAATVNPTDIMMRAGKQAGAMTGLSQPFIAGMELSGHVHAAGPGADFQVGEPVMAVVNPRRPAGGAQADYVGVPSTSVARLAPGVDIIGAATVPMNGLTAKFALDMLDMPVGATLLVTGGTGAVGGYVLQLASQKGFTTIATGYDVDAKLLRQLGATHAVGRGDAMSAGVRSLFPDGVDGLIDAALVGDAAAALVKTGGGAVALRSSHPISDDRLQSHVISVGKHMNEPAALAELARALEVGVITARVAAVLPMEQAQAAYRQVEEGGLRGRVVLNFGA